MGRHGGEPPDELGRHLVDPVCVLDRDHGRRRRQRGHQLDRGVRDALAPEPRLEHRELGGVGDLDVERGREQRERFLELRRLALHEVAQRFDDVRRGVVEAGQRAEESRRGPVRAARQVGLARDGRDLQARGLGEQLVEQARLAGAGVADQLDDPARAVDRGRERPVEQRELVVATDERQHRRPLGLSGSRRPALGRLLPERDRVHRLRLALDRQRGELRGLERRARARHEVGGGEDLPRFRGGHEPRREVDGVAHHGVRPPVPRTDLTGEHVTAVHADPDRQRELRVLQAPHRAEHPALVVAVRDGHAGREDDLPAVAIDVGGEERDALRVGGCLRRVHELVDRTRSRTRARRRDEVVDAVEVHEADGRGAVLRFDRPVTQVLAQRDRHRGRDVGLARRTGLSVDLVRAGRPRAAGSRDPGA